MSSKIFVVFRYDDYTPSSPFDVEKKLFSIFRDYRKSLTVGIVPFLTAGKYHDPYEQNTIQFSDEKIRFIKECIKSETVHPALHGFNHKSWTGIQPHSEFKGQSKEKQFLMIKNGKERIETLFETSIDTFIPPWNTYDENTLECLYENNIKCISANRFGTIIKNEELQYLPITIEFFQLKEAINSVSGRDNDNIISILLHPYDFEGSGDARAKITWDDFKQQIEWLDGKNNIQIVSIHQVIRDKIQIVNHERYYANKSSIVENVYPWFLKTTYDELTYKPAGDSKRIKAKKLFLTFLFYTLNVILFFYMGEYSKIFISKYCSSLLITILNYSLVVVSFVFITKAIISKSLYTRSLSIQLTLISFFMGVYF